MVVSAALDLDNKAFLVVLWRAVGNTVLGLVGLRIDATSCAWERNQNGKKTKTPTKAVRSVITRAYDVPDFLLSRNSKIFESLYTQCT